MLKKILLSILLLSLAGQNIYPSNDNKFNMLGAVVGGCAVAYLALGVIGYWSGRETNSSIINRAKICIYQNASLLNEAEDYARAFQGLVRDIPYAIVNGQKKYYFDFVGNENKLVAYRQQLLDIHDALSSRYDSFLKPWNWSRGMGNAISDIKNVIKNIDQLLYGCTLQRVIGFNTICGKFVNDIILSFELKGIVSILIEEKIKKDEIEEFLRLANILTTELSERSSRVHDYDTYETKKNRNDLEILIEQAQFLDIMCNYGSLILNMQTKEKLIAATKNFNWDSTYLLLDLFKHINNDINKVKSMHILSKSYVQNGIRLLGQVNIMLASSDEYRIERRAYDSYLEQKRQTEAAQKNAVASERQAKATQEAVYAAERQARAAEERNRIERERNELERRKEKENIIIVVNNSR